MSRRRTWLTFLCLVASLAGATAGAQEVAPDDPTKPDPAAAASPRVQMLLPGFAVRELPVELTNINNVKYRADGTLVALAYDGKVWLLRDTDGDGLEDDAQLFWDNPSGMRAPIGMDLTPPSYHHGDGLFVAGKTRCVLIVDVDGDEKADKEIEVAGGWAESFHNVDGLGVAFDPRDGSVYYGRGTYNFADPLLRDKDGVSKYSLTDESGAVIHVAPDFKSRQVVATGIRFPVGLRLNRHGDLFATDQEGATWVPNGNPLDELLHIQEGRHYGFPARHPTFLPNVIDEPSTFDYGPQHQCVCGLNFNEPVRPGGPVFGPAAWADDVFVTGYSRGKLYRTQLVKTAAGHVARTQIVACLNMLTVDACPGPAGELVIACHSGGPDWGSGPTGRGKLLKVTYIDRDYPQPSLVWPAGPRELRVEFDQPVDAVAFSDSLEQAKLVAGRYVRAGDRFESLAPGYAAVEAQKGAARWNSFLHSATLTPDRRTLVLGTDAMTQAVHYALTLPDGVLNEAIGRKGAMPQEPSIDLDFDLSGCEATWKPAGAGPLWTGWLPHLDLEVCRRLTAGSAHHDALWQAMGGPGQLTLRTQLVLNDMLRPAVQPGSKLDYEYPPEAVTVEFQTSQDGATLQLETPAQAGAADAGSQLTFAVPMNAEKLIPVTLRVVSTGALNSLTVTWTTNEDDRPRPLPLHRLLLPWADPPSQQSELAATALAPELAGGDWARGRHEFFGEQAACSKCHAVRGEGGGLGPDLSNLLHRDYASVLRDITQPSFAINPDHLTYVVLLSDGRTLAGVVRTSGGKLLIGDANGKVTEVDRAEVDEMQPSSLSTMPEGLPKQLGEDRLRDLLTFLLTAPPDAPASEPATQP